MLLLGQLEVTARRPPCDRHPAGSGHRRVRVRADGAQTTCTQIAARPDATCGPVELDEMVRSRTCEHSQLTGGVHDRCGDAHGRRGRGRLGHVDGGPGASAVI